MARTLGAAQQMTHRRPSTLVLLFVPCLVVCLVLSACGADVPRAPTAARLAALAQSLTHLEPEQARARAGILEQMFALHRPTVAAHAERIRLCRAIAAAYTEAADSAKPPYKGHFVHRARVWSEEGDALQAIEDTRPAR